MLSIHSKNDSISPGFSESVHDAQAVFRTVLNAMSEPGTLHDLTGIELLKENSDFFSTSYALALSLFDNSTRICLSPSVDDEHVKNSLNFHCGCVFETVFKMTQGTAAKHVDAKESSVDFFILNADEWFDYYGHGLISIGDLSYPEKSTTIILQVNSLSEARFARAKGFRLSGPGIENSRDVFISNSHDASDAAFFESIQKNQTTFPLGLDFILCSKEKVMALPRSVVIEEMETN